MLCYFSSLVISTRPNNNNCGLHLICVTELSIKYNLYFKMCLFLVYSNLESFFKYTFVHYSDIILSWYSKFYWVVQKLQDIFIIVNSLDYSVAPEPLWCTSNVLLRNNNEATTSRIEKFLAPPCGRIKTHFCALSSNKVGILH